ncbi:MAG: rhomboid family intramembrane serine protease [Fidelibacterota bacterium]
MSYYNSNSTNYGQYHMRPQLFKGAIKVLIITNLVVFLVTNLLGINNFVFRFFGLVPKAVWSNGFIWQLFTYMFVHGGFMHLFMNMFVLWMFGMELENYWGKQEFLRFFIITGIGSGLITFLFSLNSTIPVVGASGAVYALLLAFAMMFPERRIYLYFLFPIPAKYFVLIIGLVTFFSSIRPTTGGISHLTHLGGLVVGYIYLKRNYLKYKMKQWLPNISIKNPFSKIIRKVEKDKSKSTNNSTKYDTDETMREQVNIILDKISREGYDNLTEDEKRTLYLASQYFAEHQKKS